MPTPAGVRPSLDVPMMKLESVGLISNWNSFWLPAKAGLDMRTSGPYRGENGPDAFDLAEEPVAPEISSPASHRSYRAVSRLSYLAWLTFMSSGRFLRTSGKGPTGPVATRGTDMGAWAWVAGRAPKARPDTARARAVSTASV